MQKREMKKEDRGYFIVFLGRFDMFLLIEMV